MASQQQTSNTPESLRDSWQTPDWLYRFIEKHWSTAVDMAASRENSKCEDFLTKEDDALSKDWMMYHNPDWETIFCNPPYSETGKWLEKAWQEAQKGAQIVMLVPAPNGEKYFGDYVFDKASTLTMINGRVAFELPQPDGTAKPQPSNPRGSCLIYYGKTHESPTELDWIDRDKVRAEYGDG